MKNNNNIFSLDEYLSFVEQTKTDNELIDVRFLFFYLKKLNKFMIMKKSVTASADIAKTSTTSIRELKLDKSLKLSSIDPTSSEEMEDFILSNARKIIYNDSEYAIYGKTQTRVDTFNYDRDPEYFLEYLFVKKQYRNCGIAKTLINEAKNSSINNGINKLTGQIRPIDTQPKHLIKFRQWLNELTNQTGLFKNLSYVDFQTLVKIYTHLGFSINDDSRFTDPRLLMKLNEKSIPADKKLPDEFTRFAKNGHTTMLFG